MNNSDDLPKAARNRITAVVVAGILVIAAVSYFVFDVPAWLSILGAVGAILLNGVILMFAKKSE